MKTPLAALLIGTALTLLLFGLGYVAAQAEAMTLSYGLYWQAWVLFQLLPCAHFGFADGFLCENQRVAMVTFYAGIPVGIVLYSLIAWAGLALWRRPKPASP